jgi:serine/threonine protein kinase
VQGTPNETNWPAALKLPDFKTTFPKWKGIPLSAHTVNLDEYGLDLLASTVALEPHKRISCRMAMQHPYFDDLDKSKLAKDY